MPPEKVKALKRKWEQQEMDRCNMWHAQHA